MTLASTKDKAKVGLGGGGEAWLRQVTSAGVDLGTPDTNHSVGYIETSDLDDNTEEVKVYDETGALVANVLDKRTVVWKCTLQQSSGDEIAIMDECRGKFYRLYTYSGIRNNKHQEWLYGICTVKPHLALAWKTGAVTNIPLEITILKVDTQITALNTDLPTVKKTAGSIIVAAGAYYKMTETAVV